MNVKRLGIAALLLAAGWANAQSAVVWTGGVTEEEREAAPNRGTTLEFFVTGGSFLSAVQVIVKERSSGREVVNTTTTGPWLILDLPAGDYSVRAQRENGQAQGGNITVAGDSGKFGFMFPES